MAFSAKNGLRYFSFPALSVLGLQHGIFTRHGGVSPQPWQSLNLGGTVGDDPAHVQENLRRAFQALERPLKSRFDAWQVHGVDVLVADQPRNLSQPVPKADVILTNSSEVTLMMRFADCVPVLLFDPRCNVLGLVHAGWQGTIKKAPAAAVKAMKSRFGSRPADILAAIGPSIGVDHYQIGQNVAGQVQTAFGDHAKEVLPVNEQGMFFDLWAANRHTLVECGVLSIEVAGLCTACHLEDWFSHRAEKGHAGRFGLLAALPE